MVVHECGFFLLAPRDRSDTRTTTRLPSPRPALCGTVILGASVAAGFAGFRSHVVENVTAPIQASRPTSASTDAETADVPQTTTRGHDAVVNSAMIIANRSQPATKLRITARTMAEADAVAMATGWRSTSSAQRARRVWNDSVQAKSCGRGSMCMAGSLGSGDRISIKILRMLRRRTAKNMPFTEVRQM
jgi:hypothetical protein